MIFDENHFDENKKLVRGSIEPFLQNASKYFNDWNPFNKR